jgi:hypothetical protein
MRNIVLKAGVNTDTTRIFVEVNGKEVRLDTFFDNNATKLFRSKKSALPPMTGSNLVDALIKKLNNDVVNLDAAEVNYIVAAFKKELAL